MYACQECGRKFRSAKAAERAAFGDNGCPGCGGSDIDNVPDDPQTDRYHALKAGTVKPETLTEECIAAGTEWYPPTPPADGGWQPGDFDDRDMTPPAVIDQDAARIDESDVYDPPERTIELE